MLELCRYLDIAYAPSLGHALTHPAYHLLHQCSHPPSWGHIPLPPPCMCSMGFCPHIPGSHPCLRFHPHQSRVLSPPEVSSSPSMVHDHTFAAAWRVVGGCCFYEGKGPLVSVRAHPRLGVYVTSGYLQSSDISTRGHSRGMGPC